MQRATNKNEGYSNHATTAHQRIAELEQRPRHVQQELRPRNTASAPAPIFPSRFERRDDDHSSRTSNSTFTVPMTPVVMRMKTTVESATVSSWQMMQTKDRCSEQRAIKD